MWQAIKADNFPVIPEEGPRSALAGENGGLSARASRPDATDGEWLCAVGGRVDTDVVLP